MAPASRPYLLIPQVGERPASCPEGCYQEPDIDWQGLAEQPLVAAFGSRSGFWACMPQFKQPAMLIHIFLPRVISSRATAWRANLGDHSLATPGVLQLQDQRSWLPSRMLPALLELHQVFWAEREMVC